MISLTKGVMKAFLVSRNRLPRVYPLAKLLVYNSEKKLAGLGKQLFQELSLLSPSGSHHSWKMKGDPF